MSDYKRLETHMDCGNESYSYHQVTLMGTSYRVILHLHKDATVITILEEMLRLGFLQHLVNPKETLRSRLHQVMVTRKLLKASQSMWDVPDHGRAPFVYTLTEKGFGVVRQFVRNNPFKSIDPL